MLGIKILIVVVSALFLLNRWLKRTSDRKSTIIIFLFFIIATLTLFDEELIALSDNFKNKARGSNTYQLIDQSDNATGIPLWQGPINRDFLKFVNGLSYASEFKITSNGGEGFAALYAGEVIERKQLKMVVVGGCASACVDFLFAAAARIRLEGNPIISLHGNPVSALNSMNKFNLTSRASDTRDCNVLALSLQQLWARNNVRKIYQLEQMPNMQIRNVVLDTPRCPIVNYVKRFWLPTGSELRDIFGDKVWGQTCSDIQTCIEGYIVARRWHRSEVIVKGE